MRTALQNLIVGTAALAVPALAVAQHETSYRYFQLAYQQVDQDIEQGNGTELDAEGDGFQAELSWLLGKIFIVRATVGGLEIETGDGNATTADTTNASLAFGIRQPITANLDAFALLSGEYSSSESVVNNSVVEVNEGGWGATAGLRAQVTDWFELNTEVNYTDFTDVEDGDTTTFSVGAVSELNKRYDVLAGAAVSEDQVGVEVGVRVNF